MKDCFRPVLIESGSERNSCLTSYEFHKQKIYIPSKGGAISTVPITYIKTHNIAFQYESENFLYDLEAQVEQDGDDSYSCVNIVGAEDVGDELWRCMASKAEDLAWERDNQPRNTHTGCDCLPKVNPLDQAIHDDTCPLRLRGEEREAFEDLVRKESRSGYRSSYDEGQQGLLDENTAIYLELK